MFSARLFVPLSIEIKSLLIMRFTTHSPLRLLCTALAFILPLAGAAQMKVTSLTVEHMKNPSTVDETAPRLSWVNEARDAKVRGERQTAYRIVVASSKEKLLAGDFDLWDSGKVLSEQSTLVPYGGQRLTSGQDCYWKVQTWNARRKVSPWSETGYWGMGLLSPSDWKAQWISANQEKGAPLYPRTRQRLLQPPHAPRPPQLACPEPQRPHAPA